MSSRTVLSSCQVSKSLGKYVKRDFSAKETWVPVMISGSHDFHSAVSAEMFVSVHNSGTRLLAPGRRDEVYLSYAFSAWPSVIPALRGTCNGAVRLGSVAYFPDPTPG